MSFTSINGGNMDLPFARESINLSGTTVVPKSKVKAEEDENDTSVPTTTTTKRAREKMQATEDEKESPTKKNRTGKKAGPLGPIPMSYEEAGMEDRLIIEMREKDGKQWLDIKAAIEEITGTKFGNTTLKGRYARMKTNFVVFEKEHEPILLDVKKDIEEKFEIEKWQKIADGIEARCGQKYPATAIQKRYKQLSKRVNTVEQS